MLNGPAEELLGIGSIASSGQRLDRYVVPSSYVPLMAALNEASQTSSASPTGKAKPIATRLQLLPADSPSPAGIWAEISISAWFATDTLFNSTSDASSQSSTKKKDLAGASSASQSTANTLLRVPHEAFFTISMLPSSSGVEQESNITESERNNAVEVLRELVFQTLDVPVMALSKDGKTEISNKACLEFFSEYSSASGDESNLLPQADRVLTLYDENFEKPSAETDWPIYKCAFLGQSSPKVVMGVEKKSTGKRVYLEIASKVIRNKGGYGEHIGGVCTLRDITEERERMKSEVESQGDIRFKQSVDVLPQLVWISGPSGYINWYSKSFHDYTGSSMQEIEGTGWQGVMHDDDMDGSKETWSHSLRHGVPVETAYRLKRHDGVYRWFLGRGIPITDPTTGEIEKWFGTSTDIHDQVEALSASRQAQSRLQSVINHAAVTLWAVDREGIITVAEGPGIRQLGLMTSGVSKLDASSQQPADTVYDSENSNKGSGSNNTSSCDINKSIIGQSIYKIWNWFNIHETISKALTGETVIEEMEIDGRWFRTSSTPLRAHRKDVLPLQNNGDEVVDVDTSEGDIVGVVGTSMDITDRKRAQIRMEESLLEKTRALAAEDAAQEASRLKSEFLANMSHEIRTPIAGIIGLSELVLDERNLTSGHRENIETIQRSAEGLLNVINDVLDFSKVEIGKLDMDKVPFNLVVLLRDIKRMLNFAMQKKGLEFRDSIDLQYKGRLVGDLGRLRQVITNLLTNAIKFTVQGYVSLEVSQLPQVDYDDNSILVRFDIRDTGCGIQPESLSRLFQPFTQADASTARKFGGTGLGLSISKNLVELMSGKIGLDSIKGQGSHAWFIIPFQKAINKLGNEEAQSQRFENNAESNEYFSEGNALGGRSALLTTSLTRPREDIWILIAEDNAINARIASANVERLGFNCQIAENGFLALEQLHKRNYDLVLMDCQMPECDGYEATRLIRASPNVDLRTLPIIALTASAIKGDREKALSAGMVDYLAKPAKRTALESTLCKWLFDYNARQNLAMFLPMTPI